jgi:hypothetical protein
MLIEIAWKSKWPEAARAPSLTAFARLAGPEGVMKNMCSAGFCIGSSKYLQAGFYG